VTRQDTILVHAEHCDDCRSAPLPVIQIAALLDAATVSLDAGALSQRTMLHLQPVMQRRAAFTLWKRVATCVLLALLPLPAVLAYDAYILRMLFQLVSTLLPATVAAYFVFSYAALLVLLFALTYASIPLLLHHDTLATRYAASPD
jgi:hypothetical protein